MATFTNQALLTYNDTRTLSNITTGQLTESLSVIKDSLQTSYSAGDRITYLLSVVNSGTAERGNLTVTDDLGAIVPEGGTTEVCPLVYESGSIRSFLNGAPQPAPQVLSESPLTVAGLTVPAGGCLLLIYTAQLCAFAPLAQGSTVVNTAAVTGDGLSEPLTASYTLYVNEAPYLTVEKTLSPLSVSANQRITYTFLISNYGNADADENANAVITDTITPPLTDLTVTYNGAPWTESAEYTYEPGTGLFTTADGEITVPAATYTTAPDGTVTTIPGTVTLVVEGTVS